MLDFYFLIVDGKTINCPILGCKVEITENHSYRLIEYKVYIDNDQISINEYGTFTAFENGTYTFTIILTKNGQKIEKQVVVDEIQQVGSDYEILVKEDDESILDPIYLGNKQTKELETIDGAWLVYHEKIHDIKGFLWDIYLEDVTLPFLGYTAYSNVENGTFEHALGLKRYDLYDGNDNPCIICLKKNNKFYTYPIWLHFWLKPE